MGRPDIRAEVVLLRDGRELTSWPLECAGRVDLAVVDHLAHLQLAARRLGCEIWLRRACPDLAALVELAGLRGVLGLQVLGQAEGGEEAGVEEAVVPDDPVA